MASDYDAAIRYGSNSGKQDYMTPPWILEIAREAMGGPFDLDVASSAVGNLFVKAERYFTEMQDALRPGRPWIGKRVWMNFPFPSKTSPPGWAKAWIGKFIYEYECGNIEQGICITYAQMNTKWGMMLGKFPRWHPPRRVNYILPETLKPDPRVMKGSMLTYLGPYVNNFAKACLAVGGTVDIPWGFHGTSGTMSYGMSFDMFWNGE
jgi:hypothetical protein